MTTFNLSPEQLAGQRLMVGFEGINLNRDLMFLIDTLKVGGIILFAYNLSTPTQIKDLCDSLQQYAAFCGLPPLFIAIDQEGGQVARLKEPFTQFPGNPAMQDARDASHFAEVTAAELTNVGVNMNMAPVLDLAAREGQSIMAGRSFGENPDWVATMGRTVINGLQQAGIMSVAKHFPGIGRTVLDSHLDLPTVDVAGDLLAASDLIPFADAIANDVAGIMLSHIRYAQIDPDWPASLSTAIAKNLLRDHMGYRGLVLTDDLDMGAIKKHYDIQTAMERILAADIDLTLICHKGPDIQTAFDTILQRQQKDPDLKARGEAAVERILKVKERYIKM
jgi:beta-N-acetylhexosaminidase